MRRFEQAPDPWQRTTTEHGVAADEVMSAPQKSFRGEMGRDYRRFMDEASTGDRAQ